MGHSILEELVKIKNAEEKSKIRFPKATYLFVENYGRKLHTEMEEIAALLQAKKWFTLQADWSRNEKGVFEAFQVELQRNSILGKAFEGCILIELAGEAEEGELRQILESLKEQEEKITFFVTAESMECAEEIKRHMDRYFFTRIIEGNAYDVGEQWSIVKDELEAYGLTVEEGAGEKVQSHLEEIRWHTTDLVRQRLENAAKQIAYEKMLDADGGSELTAEEIVRGLDIFPENKKKSQIGFLLK